MSQAGMKTGLIMMLAIIGGLGGWLPMRWFKKRLNSGSLSRDFHDPHAITLFAAFTS